MFSIPLAELVMSLFAGAFTLLGGVLTSRLARESKRESTKLETALTTLFQEASEARAAAASASSKESTPERTALAFVEQRVEKPLVQGVTRLIEDYHEQGLNQAAVQFWFSVAAASVGFVWILYAGTQFKAGVPSTALKSIPGAVIDAVAALFFKQASETRQRATELYDRLRKDKQTDDAMCLVDAIDSPRARSAIRAQIALHLAGLTPGVLNLEYFLPPDMSSVETSSGIHPTPIKSSMGGATKA